MNLGFWNFDNLIQYLLHNDFLNKLQNLGLDINVISIHERDMLLDLMKNSGYICENIFF